MKCFLQWLKRCLRSIRLQFLPIFSALSLSFMTMALLFGALLIMTKAAALGGFFWPVLLTYLGGLAAAVAVLHHRREQREFRAMVGEEEFYRIYPRIRRREERRKRRKERKIETNRKDPDK